MKLKKIFALCISAALMMTGCIQKNDDVELSEEEMEHNAVIGWFENDIFDNEEFTDLTDYQYYARTIGLEKDELLSPDMWEVYYSESININKEIDGSAVYLIRLNPDKLLEVWSANNDMTVEEICTELGTNRDDLYYNFGYTANSIGYAKNHKDNKVSYPEAEERIFGVDNGENRQAVFSTHFLKVHTPLLKILYEIVYMLFLLSFICYLLSIYCYRGVRGRTLKNAVPAWMAGKNCTVFQRLRVSAPLPLRTDDFAPRQLGKIALFTQKLPGNDAL